MNSNRFADILKEQIRRDTERVSETQAEAHEFTRLKDLGGPWAAGAPAGFQRLFGPAPQVRSAPATSRASVERIYGRPPQVTIRYTWNTEAQLAMQALERLGVPCSRQGSMADLKTVYRAQLKRFHPDLAACGQDTKTAHERFLMFQSYFEICFANPPTRKVERG